MVKIGLFKRKKRQEIRADTAQSAETSILTFFGITGELTREAALSIPTVSACIGKIGETISQLPVKLYRKDEEQVTEIFDDPRIKLLNGSTGDTLSTVDMWKAAVEDYYLGRGAWIFVNSSGLSVKSLHYVDSRDVSILSNTDPIFKAFRVQINAQNYYDFQFIKLLRRTRDGYTNIPLQEEASSVLSAAWNALKLENMMNSNGGCKPGFLKAKSRLSDAAISAIKEGYQKVYDNEQKRDKIIVLNDGVDFEAISSTAAELQMNENKKTNSIEICKLFGFPHTVIDGGATEDDNKKFTAAVIALLNQIETELDNILLLEEEKEQGYYWAFDTKELTRGSLKERYDAYEIAVRNNILQVDEIRREEDYEPLGFNFVKLGLSDVLLNPETMEVFTPNTGQQKNLLTGEERAEDVELRYNHNHDEKGRFASGGGGFSGGGKSGKKVDKSEKNDIIKLEDIDVGKSVGAKAKNYDIMDLETGEHFNLVEGTSLQDVEVFAGKGVKSEFRKADKYAKKYGGKAKDWQHTKGTGTVDYYGEGRKAELHWAQCEGIGKHDFFIKRWLE
ncbi:phage portal protein [Ruminococcus sp.]|uniref:phage portal protein n=1 Tax=Ruminococcus sp. TaxID=41978 RepID=UPI0025F608E6|nr:phage portal protein [Ruminococcus sp.]MBQ6250178.1 phage portal protein [Ruminococcus sp.]